jgi:hypothetical protein
MLLLAISFLYISGQSSTATYTQVVNQAVPSIVLGTSATSIHYGEAVTVSAALHYSPDGITRPATSATGTLTFYDGAAVVGTVPVANATGTVTFPKLTGGTHIFTAQYSGDSNFKSATASTSANTEVLRSAPSLTLTSSKSPANYAEDVTFTAHLPADATGTVTFHDGADTIGTGTVTPDLTNGTADAAFVTSDLSVGSHQITAVYSGDGNYTVLTSSAITQNINKADSIIELSADPNHSPVSTQTTFTALVSTGGTVIAPTEQIVFSEGATSLQTVTATPVTTTNLLLQSDALTKNAWQTANATVDSGRAQGPSTNTAANGFTTTVPNGYIYQALTGLTPNTSYTFSAWLNAPDAPVSLAIGIYDTSWNQIGAQTCDLTSAWKRCRVTAKLPSGVTAAYVSLGNGSEAGIHVLAWGAQAEAGTTAGPYVRTGASKATATGVRATYSIDTFEAGSHTITARYSGNDSVNPGEGTTTVNTGKAASTVTLAASADTTTYGDPVTYTVTVQTLVGHTPTGTVRIKDGGTEIASVALDSTGKATFTTAALTGGTHSIIATYDGDANYQNSDSNSVGLTVNKATSAAAVDGSPNPSRYGDLVTVTITVTGVGATPTGTATILADGAPLAPPAPLNQAGVATVTTNELPAGDHAITVTYSGDKNYK